jgi:hypothetical protein
MKSPTSRSSRIVLEAPGKVPFIARVEPPLGHRRIHHLRADRGLPAQPVRKGGHQFLGPLDALLEDLDAPVRPGVDDVRLGARNTGTPPSGTRRRGVAAALNPTVAARQIAALIEGIQLAWLYDDSVDMAAHLEEFMRLIRIPGT